MCPSFSPQLLFFFFEFFSFVSFRFFFCLQHPKQLLKKESQRSKESKRTNIGILTHTQNTNTYTNNVCCYSTNRVRRRPQGHQGSGAYSLLLVLSFFLILPISSSACSSHRARAFDDDANFLPYLILQKRIDVCDDARERSDLRCALLVSPRE